MEHRFKAAKNMHATLRADAQTIRDVISPWAGVGPDPAQETDTGEASRTRLASYLPFGERVVAALVPFLAGFVGPVAMSWVEEEVDERGEPADLISALALGHALVTRIPDPQLRDSARHALDALLRGLKTSSLVPPPVRARSG